MKKQTAVEWLVNELNQKIDFIPMDKWDIIRDIVQQSLAMEKEQIIDTYNKAAAFTLLQIGEQYYNETYGK
jgi:hypothetical protein